MRAALQRPILGAPKESAATVKSQPSHPALRDDLEARPGLCFCVCVCVCNETVASFSLKIVQTSLKRDGRCSVRARARAQKTSLAESLNSISRFNFFFVFNGSRVKLIFTVHHFVAIEMEKACPTMSGRQVERNT